MNNTTQKELILSIFRYVRNFLGECQQDTGLTDGQIEMISNLLSDKFEGLYNN